MVSFFPQSGRCMGAYASGGKRSDSYNDGEMNDLNDLEFDGSDIVGDLNEHQMK